VVLNHILFVLNPVFEAS